MEAKSLVGKALIYWFSRTKVVETENRVDCSAGNSRRRSNTSVLHEAMPKSTTTIYGMWNLQYPLVAGGIWRMTLVSSNKFVLLYQVMQERHILCEDEISVRRQCRR